MITKCSKCENNINRNHPGVQCGGFCHSFFHSNEVCCELNRDQAKVLRSSPGTKWICGLCRGSADRVQTDTSVHRRSSMISGTVDINTNADNVNIINELKLLRESVTFCSEKVSDFEATLRKISDCIKITEKLKLENEKLRTELFGLTNRVNNMDQLARSNNIEILGVPELPGENLIKVVQNIGCFINHKIDDHMIDFVHRVPTRNGESKPKNIVLRLTSRYVKDNIIGAARIKIRESAHKKLLLPGATEPIYLNEHLTPQNKALFRETRNFARQHGYKFSWVRNGNIFIRRDDRSKVISITNIEALGKLA